MVISLVMKRASSTGIVEKNIDRSMGGGCLINRCSDSGFVSDVAADKCGFSAVITDRRFDRPALILLTHHQDDLRRFTGKRTGPTFRR